MQPPWSWSRNGQIWLQSSPKLLQLHRLWLQKHCLVSGAQINYTQIGNIFRLHNRIQPFAALFWALGIVLVHILKQLTQPAGPASLKFGRGQLGSIRRKKSFPLPFSLLAVYLFYVWQRERGGVVELPDSSVGWGSGCSNSYWPADPWV